jgi:hypothetical protein
MIRNNYITAGKSNIVTIAKHVSTYDGILFENILDLKQPLDSHYQQKVTDKHFGHCVHPISLLLTPICGDNCRAAFTRKEKHAA